LAAASLLHVVIRQSTTSSGPSAAQSLRVGSFFYTTAHSHKHDDCNVVRDGCVPVEMPDGYEVAPGDANDMCVCAEHPWQSYCLVFADGDLAATDLCPELDDMKGEKLGKSGFLMQHGRRVWVKQDDVGENNELDVLLRKPVSATPAASSPSKAPSPPPAIVVAAPESEQQ
jgi:hypothetical protein